jgi:hypothetical protein
MSHDSAFFLAIGKANISANSLLFAKMYFMKWISGLRTVFAIGIYISERRENSPRKSRDKVTGRRGDACGTTLQLGRIGRAYLLIYVHNCAAQIITGLVHANHKFKTVGVLAQTWGKLNEFRDTERNICIMFRYYLIPLVNTRPFPAAVLGTPLPTPPPPNLCIRQNQVNIKNGIRTLEYIVDPQCDLL